MPEPLAGATVSHDVALLDTVQFTVDVTVMVVLPPAGCGFQELVDSISPYAAFCVTVTVRVVAPGAVTVIVPVLDVVAVLINALMLKEPLPVPVAGKTDSHETLLVARHPTFDVTVTWVLLGAAGEFHSERDSVSIAVDGVACVLAKAPAPTELTALTLKVCVPADRF